ncbi:MAG: hypothetical protein JWO20_2715 [Candidatus Angelobacter sp.]|jgi:hypothetical protein|nr:hypothetical protein [Candidatus Angelobacter sp.]
MATDYKQIFKQVKTDIAAKRQELGESMRTVEGLEAEIAGLQQTALGLARMLGEEFVAEDEIGLTDAVRNVFKSALPSKNFTALEVRDELQAMGYDITKYGNVMASIHSVIKRLIDKDIKFVGTRGDSDKPAYQWKFTAADLASPVPSYRISTLSGLRDLGRKK